VLRGATFRLSRPTVSEPPMGKRNKLIHPSYTLCPQLEQANDTHSLDVNCLPKISVTLVHMYIRLPFPSVPLSATLYTLCGLRDTLNISISLLTNLQLPYPFTRIKRQETVLDSCSHCLTSPNQNQNKPLQAAPPRRESLPISQPLHPLLKYKLTLHPGA
jgi:hypothetical protein